MFVILGPTGKIGGATIGALRKAGAPVRAALRDEAKSARFAALDCEVAVANIQDGASLARAMDGADAVQIICPIEPQAIDAAAAMRRSIEAMAEAIERARPRTVLAISDYGAHIAAGTGVTALFHALETRLRRVPSRLIFVRSAEHMENWARAVKAAAETGVLSSPHAPLTKRFPTVSAFDVGAAAAELLLAPAGDNPLRIVHVEGPQRYTPIDVAKAMSAILGREIVAQEVPRGEQEAWLARGGISQSYARLIVELYDAHNAGRIDAEAGTGEIRKGASELVDAFAALAPAGRK